MMTSLFFVLCLCVVGVSGYVNIYPYQTFQWQLTKGLDTSVDAEVYDIDLFDNSASVIQHLKDSGKTVICYLSAGTYEDWRDDVGSVPERVLGEPLDDWAGERWWDINDDIVRDIMISRLDLAEEKGCDGVEPDNVDAYDNDNGLDLSPSDLIDFIAWLSYETRSRNMSIGLKNALDIISDCEPLVDWALNEQCFQFSECDKYEPFLDNGKAVFHTEYVKKKSQGSAKKNAVCGNVPDGFTTIIKKENLDAWRLTC